MFFFCKFLSFFYVLHLRIILVRAILCITLIRVLLLLSNICEIFNTSFQLNNNLLNYVKVPILRDFFYESLCLTESLPPKLCRCNGWPLEFSLEANAARVLRRRWFLRESILIDYSQHSIYALAAEYLYTRTDEILH